MLRRARLPYPSTTWWSVVGVAIVISRSELLAEAWHQRRGGADKTVDVRFSWLRRKLGESAAAPVYLHTVHGVGVKLGPPRGARAEHDDRSPLQPIPIELSRVTCRSLSGAMQIIRSE